MALLVCSATEMEIAPFRDWIEKNNHPVSFLITGVGMLATTYSLTKAVFEKRPDMIIQAGVAGALDTALALGSVYAIRRESIGDLGVEEGGTFRSVRDLGLLGTDEFPWVSGQLTNTSILLERSGLPLIDGVTVNEISTNPERIKLYKDQSGASAESMEGAALHYVALCQKIPFLQIRSLSNFAGERDKSKWMMKKAIEELNKTLSVIVPQILSSFTGVTPSPKK